MTTSSKNRVGWLTKMGYGAGHILNDMCGAMWFTYSLIFFHQVLELDHNRTGLLYLIGQAAGGLSTLLVGSLSDSNYNFWLCSKYGRRKSWHLIGTLCVLLSFPFIFSACIKCSPAADEDEIVYFGAFIVLFQFGWSAVQISHLAMIPKLTPSSNERTTLTAIRHAGTVLSTLVVYCILLAFLGYQQGRKLDPQHAPLFQYTAIIALSIGFIATVIFYVITQQNSNTTNEENKIEANERAVLPSDNEKLGDKCEPVSIFTWLSKPRFYQVGALYMFARLFVYVAQGNVPLYLIQTLHMNSASIAVIPIVMFVTDIFNAVLTKFVSKKLGRNLAFAMYCLVGGSACLWINWGSSDDAIFTGYEIYIIAILIGCGGSGMRILGVSIVSDLIGTNTDSSAFIYGSMSLLDKIGNGIATMLIQHFVPDQEASPENIGLYYKNVLFLVCGTFSIGGMLCALSLSVLRKVNSIRSSIDNLTHDNTTLDEENEEHESLDSIKNLVDNKEMANS